MIDNKVQASDDGKWRTRDGQSLTPPLSRCRLSVGGCEPTVRHAALLVVVMVVPAALVAVAAAPASAHVLRTAGPCHLLIGFGIEPTYAGAQNSVFLLLTRAKTGAPVVDEGLGDTLKVEVGFGSRHRQFPLVSSCDPDSGQGIKGVYNAYFIPTVQGSYTFHFFVGSTARRSTSR